MSQTRDQGKRKPETGGSTGRKSKKKARFAVKDLHHEPEDGTPGPSVRTEAMDKTTVLSHSSGRSSVHHTEKQVELTSEEILWLESTADVPDNILDPTSPPDSEIRALMDALPPSAAESLEPPIAFSKKTRARPEQRAAVCALRVTLESL